MKTMSISLPAPLNHPLAIVDLETTGAHPGVDRVIEVGVILIDDGEVSLRWQRLINPEQRFSPFIEQLTGITPAMVADAPRFAEIADELQTLLQGRIFVAHNARFDYGFLKSEYERLGVQFAPERLCTVRWSRQLYPLLRGHGLDAICQRLGIANEARHRALGDAEATWQFLRQSCREHHPDTLHAAFVKQMQRPSLPPAITPERINSVPNCPGIYRFYGDEGKLLYIGKSKQLRERIMSHFNASPVSARNQRLHSQIRDLDWQCTAGELGALLKENQAIKKEQPLFNRRLRRVRELVAVTTKEDAQGYLRCQFSAFEKAGNKPLALFRNRSQAKAKLLELAKEHQLCKKLLGLETGKGACFDLQLKRCKGACNGSEPPAIYNLRLQTALKPAQIRSWPYPGPIGIVERDEEREELHLIDHWCYLGTVRDESDIADCLENPRQFELDTYRLLVRAVRSRLTIRQFPGN